MYVTCPKPECGILYNDEQSWTICPHNNLSVPHDAVICERCDLYVGYTNIYSWAEDRERCMVCGRTRAEIVDAQKGTGGGKPL